jgi:hypothetical protein
LDEVVGVGGKVIKIKSHHSGEVRDDHNLDTGSAGTINCKHHIHAGVTPSVSNEDDDLASESTG